MKRKLLALSAIIVLSATLFTVVDAGVAGAVPNASGSVVCNITGKGAFTPKLTLAGGSTALAITFGGGTTSGCFASATTSSSSGTVTPVTISGVTVTATGSLVPLSSASPNKCSVFKGSDTIGVIKVKYVWASVPAIAPTVVTFTGGTTHIVAGAPTDNIVLPAATGTTEVGTGSFTPSVHPLVGLRTNIASACVAGWGPYPTFTFGVGSVIALP